MLVKERKNVITFVSFLMTLAACQPVMSAVTAQTAGQAAVSSHSALLHHQQLKQQVVRFPPPGKQSHRHQEEDQHHRSSAFAEAERKTDHSDVVRSSAAAGLTPVHAADYNELRGRYGYFPPSMFRDFMDDARAKTFNTLYGSIDSKGMFHPANHLAHKQSSSSLPIAHGPGSPSHHNPFDSGSASPAESLSQGSSYSLSPPSAYSEHKHKMTGTGIYTPSYPSSAGGESALGSNQRERKNRQIEIGETLSSASNREVGGNQRSLGLLSHLTHHHPYHEFIPPQMMLMPPPMMHHFGHEMMPFMPPFHAPFHSMLPMHQLDHLYGRPFMPYVSPLMAGYGGYGMMPPAYAGMGIGYPGMYHRSNNDGMDAVSPAPTGNHASQIHLSGGIYPPFRHPHHHHARHPSASAADSSHSHASHQHHVVPVAYPIPLPSHSSPPPPRTLFPYSFQPTPGSAESRPDLSFSSSSQKHGKQTRWVVDEDEERGGGSSPSLPSRPRVQEAYGKAKIHNAGSKLTAFPFSPYKRREDHKTFTKS